MRELLTLALCAASLPALAADPYVVYQARLLDAAGAPVQGRHDLRIALYADPNEGPAMWDKAVSDASLSDGYVASPLMGLDDSGRPLATALAADALYVSVSIDGGPELLPRQRLGSGVGGGTAGAFPLDASGGTTCTRAGDVRWTGTEFQGCDGSTWLVLASAGPTLTPGRAVFSTSGHEHRFRVPQDVTSLDVKLWGAGGGGGGAGGWVEGFRGGGGGFAEGTVAVNPGEDLVVIVGQGGDYRFPTGSSPSFGGGGGNRYNTSDNQYGASGGGRSALRRDGTELITAGGGGGGGSRNSTGPAGSNAGGGGGGASGQAGFQTQHTAAQGGGQSAGGTGGVGSNGTGTAGARFVGGTPGQHSYGGGGGGGWYGGGGGGYTEPGVMGGGAGGSSYVTGPDVSGGATLPASGPNPPNTSDPDYLAGAAVGGLVAGRGGDGLVVIDYAASGPATPAYENAVSFDYTGGDQGWQVPAGVHTVLVKLWGAGGGGGAPGGWTQGFQGGAGGFTTAILPVTPGETLTVMVGQAGAYRFPQGTVKTYGGGGGYNSSCDNQYGASGGGRSAIRRSGADVATAGGGGGGGSRYTTGPGGTNNGGAGGGNTGESGYQTAFARAGGGSQTGGGSGGGGENAGGQAGGQYVGGNNGVCSYGGGGGGGFYGGGGGGYDEPGTMGGGGGGAGRVPADAVWGSTVTGWGPHPPGSADPDYAAGVALGAPVAGTGGPGFVVIRY